MLIAGRNGMAAAYAAAKEEKMYKELFRATVERTVVDIDTDVLEEVGDYAFAYCTEIGRVNLPNVTALRQYAFFGTNIYGDISMPNLTTITGSLTFSARFYGDTISMPKLAELTNDRAFYNFLEMNPRPEPRTPVSVYMDSLTTITSNSFYGGSAIGLLYAPKLSSITAASAFASVGNWRFDTLPEARLVVGDGVADTGLTMAALMGMTYFPFGADPSHYGKVVWQCKDGTVTYDTAQGAWVQTPYS